MPVTANFSKAFYDKLGHQVVDELVGWFNNVDATYRADLRELNELNFARFDAKLEQRIAALDAKLEQRTAELRAEFKTALATELGRLRADLIKWSFVFFATAALAVIGLR